MTAAPKEIKWTTSHDTSLYSTDFPQAIHFYGDGNKLLFIIHKDGRIEKGPAFTTNDEMSLEFWRTIKRLFPR